MADMFNCNLSNEQVGKFKRIFTRHLKENGIYSVVKSNCFTKRNLTFYRHVTCVKGSNHLIAGLVDTIWGLINSIPNTEGFQANVKASIVLLGIAMDEDFFNLCKETGEDEYVIRQFIKQTITNEISYLFDSVADVWEDNLVTIEDAKKINEILLLHENGRTLSCKIENMLGKINGYTPIINNEYRY
jgi:hypothetical protein